MKKHGKEWHSDMMSHVEQFFNEHEYIVEREPRLNYGTGDLYVFKNGERPIFIEIGTTSLYKLLYNLSTMVGSDFLLIPKENSAIEFSVLRSNYPLS